MNNSSHLLHEAVEALNSSFSSRLLLPPLDGEMWCYQKPGFEALLLAELQRQQQCSQFCDTLLKTEGVSVPAHSCILSAISPHISAALSSTPPPPAGQSRLLDFRPLGACSLLHMVRLLYSGEMVGEGEEEKQEAISAAARLGINGLVEVTRRVCKCRHEEGEGRRAEVGVQTEPLMPEENEGRCGRWRREMRDGCTFLWKETLSGGGKETWTQTEEPAGSHPAASFETIDLAALQSLGQTDTGLPPSQIPCVPISLVYPQDENQAHQSSSAIVDSMQESTAAVVAPPYTSLRPFSSQETPCAADPHSWCSGPQRAAGNVPAAEEWTDEQFLQFQGNIPGYINYFLNPEKEERSARGRARRRRGAGVGGARRAGTGERRARRPRARTGGRGRGGLMQTVDVQEVKEGKLQKLFLHRWGMRASRVGQGGGAAGRKLYLKTRELLKPVKKRIRRGKGLDFSPSGDVPLHSEEGAGNTQHGRKSATQQFNQDDLSGGSTQRANAKPRTSVFFTSPTMRLYNNTISASSPSLQPSSPRLLSPASSFLHTTPIPPPAPPPHEEHFDRLLEEVMMGLDILPNNNSASHSQPPLPARSGTYASSGSTLTRNKQQGRATDILEAGPGFHGSTQVVVIAGGSNCADSEVPILQQQREGELNEMLENFLLSFEQHADSCAATEEMEMGGQSCTEVMNDEAESHRARAHSAVTVGTPGKVKEPAKRRKRKRKNEYPFSFEKKRVRKPASSSDAKTKMVHDRQDKQLQQMPVVKLERSGPLPVRVTLQGHSCQSLEVKSAKFSSSSVRCRRDKNKQVLKISSLKMYPIRSRFREAHMDSTPFLEQPLGHKRPPSSLQPGHRPKNNVSLCNGENSTPPIQPQPADEQRERHEEELTLPPQLEAEEPDRRGKKRGAESEEEISDDAPVAKRVCFEQMPQLTPETCTRSCESADFEPAAVEVEDVIDVMTVCLTRVEDCLQKREKTAKSEIRCSAGEEVESSGDEIIDVDGDVEDDDQGEPEKDCRQSTTAPREKPSASSASHSQVSLRSTGSCKEDKDDDIDVIGGSSPVPDPVTINWTDSSETEKEEGDEDVDVVGEKTNYALSAVFATMSEGKEEL